MNQLIVTQGPGAAVAPSSIRNKRSRQKASPQAEPILQSEDDSRVWDILGRVEFAGGSRKSPEPPCAPLQGGDAERDDDAKVWDILGQVEFSTN
jgi:hypothetical protein